MNNRKALVLIEFQNEWLDPSGKLYHYIESQLKEKNVIENTLSAIEAAKKQNFDIVHVPIMFSKNYCEVSKNMEGLLKLMPEDKRFEFNSVNSEIYKSFTPKNDEIVVRGRTGLSGFTGSNLDYILRSNGIQELYFAGFLTEICVLSTIMDAYNKNYSCRLLTDCSLGQTKEDQKYIENLVQSFIGYSLNNHQFFESLKK